MTAEKQIEEMADIITDAMINGAENFVDCIVVAVKELYNAGYRKASSVAEEIFAEIEEILIDNSYQNPEEFYEFYDKRGVKKALAELKKKYESEKDE